MQASKAGGLRAPRSRRVAFVAALACWLVGVIVYAALPEDSTARIVAATALHYAAVAFALIFLARAASGAQGRNRLLWGLLAAGLLASLVGDIGWVGLQGSAAQDLSYQHFAYLASYPFFVCALLLLVSSTTKRITFVTSSTP